jgi:hypothetical protein
MKSLVVVSLFSVAALVGLPAGAQMPGQMPAPYAPPLAPQFQQAPQVQQASPEGTVPEGMANGQSPAELALPMGDAPYGQQQPAYDPNDPNAVNAQYDPNAANYPQPDLGPDNDIAQSYDDGYDAQAYDQFQTALAPYGAWDYDSSYGYVWSPSMSVVGAGFSPYATSGHWVMSEYGWTWVSDWNWGWAPFHYGRWITRGGRGWSWVPGTMWGPAWVSWRSGNGYVGWSPLPPRGMRLAAGYGVGSPWRFTSAGSLGAAHPAFLSSRYLPAMFARTTVVSTDRLLTHGSWTVHVNAGPTRGVAGSPVQLSRAAPGVLPRVAVYPHAGVSLNERPWTRAAAAHGDALTQGWHAGVPAPQTHTFGRTPAYGSSPAARAEVRAPSPGWSPRPAATYGSTGGYGHPYSSGWSAPSARPSYGAQTAYRAPAPAYRAPAPAYRASAPAYRAPAPAYSPPRSFAPAYSPPSRSYAPPAAPPSSGGFSHFGSAGGGSTFGGSGGGHFGGFGGGGRRR